MKTGHILRLAALASALLISCNTETPTTEPEVPEGFVEKEPLEIEFTNAQIAYIGDDLGEETSDAWLLKLYTDMEIDPTGNPIGPGYVAQVLLNVSYNNKQEADTNFLRGIYVAQSSSSDFNPGTFVDGYAYDIDLPGETIVINDGTFFATVAEGSTQMDVDLIDDGAIEIGGAGEDFVIEGILVGPKCIKNRFIWNGKLEPTSYVEPEIPNSTITENLSLKTLTQMQIQDKGDYFALRDESYREIVVFLGEEGVDFTSYKPAGTGELLRLDLLVPWSWSAKDGIPEGTYPMVSRNDNNSINREDIVPYRAIPGLPDAFTVPYWAGCWYVEMASGEWGESYARIDEGSVSVERTEDGSHHIVCTLTDSSKEPYTITVEVEVDSFTTI